MPQNQLSAHKEIEPKPFISRKLCEYFSVLTCLSARTLPCHSVSMSSSYSGRCQRPSFSILRAACDRHLRGLHFGFSWLIICEMVAKIRCSIDRYDFMAIIIVPELAGAIYELFLTGASERNFLHCKQMLNVLSEL
jgi:hypothetical protein